MLRSARQPRDDENSPSNCRITQQLRKNLSEPSTPAKLIDHHAVAIHEQPHRIMELKFPHILQFMYNSNSQAQSSPPIVIPGGCSGSNPHPGINRPALWSTDLVVVGVGDNQPINAHSHRRALSSRPQLISLQHGDCLTSCGEVWGDELRSETLLCEEQFVDLALHDRRHLHLCCRLDGGQF